MEVDRGPDVGSWRTRFATDGFVHLPGFLDPAHVATVRAAIEAAGACAAPSELTRGAMRFASNVYRDAPALRDLLRSRAVVDLVVALLGPDAWVRWDQAVWKGPGAPEFPLHQDNGYTGLDHVHLQLWFALTPASAADGGLEVVPGAHARALAHRWDGSHARLDLDVPRTPLEAAPGDLIAFSSLLPHATGPNSSGATRLAYVAELLPLDIPDPSIPEPHLVACRDGRPATDEPSGGGR